MMAAAVLSFCVLSVAAAWVVLDRMKRDEEREERAHRQQLLREVRRHSDT